MARYRIDCRYFNGYKPCAPGRVCGGCNYFQKTGKRVLIINLDAQGTVLRTTSLLAPIKKKYPNSHITQLTDSKAAPLLKFNRYLDRVYEYGLESVTALMCEEFDILFSVDKSRRACAAANLVKAKEKKGYGLNRYGAIVPFKGPSTRPGYPSTSLGTLRGTLSLSKCSRGLAQGAAPAHYMLGLDDDKKFFKNKRTEQELLAEMFGLPYKRDEYVLTLSRDETAFCEAYKKKIGIKHSDTVVGFNIGSSELYPLKKISPDVQIRIIKRLRKRLEGVKILLLGGREDSAIIEAMKKGLGSDAIATPATEGLRRGICYMAPCDIVVTGDSLGMHMAIGLRKHVVAWFGPTCESEIELYGRGVKIVSDMKCRPCWKPACGEKVKCNEKVDVEEVVRAVERIYKKMSKSITVKIT